MVSWEIIISNQPNSTNNQNYQNGLDLVLQKILKFSTHDLDFAGLLLSRLVYSLLIGSVLCIHLVFMVRVQTHTHSHHNSMRVWYGCHHNSVLIDF